MLSMNATRIVQVGRNVWEVQMRPKGHWTTPDGYEAVQVCSSYENALMFVLAIMHDS